MREDKTLNLILSKLEDLDSKVDKLDTKVSKLDSKVAALDSRVDGLEVNLSNFRGEFNSFKNETNETLARIEKRVNATFDQVGGLSEYRTSTEAKLDNIESDMSYYARKQIENEKELYKLERKMAK